MLTAVAFLAELDFACPSVRTLAFPNREIPPEEEECRYEPSIEELYTDGGGDA